MVESQFYAVADSLESDLMIRFLFFIKITLFRNLSFERFEMDINQKVMSEIQFHRYAIQVT